MELSRRPTPGRRRLSYICGSKFPESRMSSIFAFFGRSVVLLAILLQGACAQLPEHVDRPVSSALPSPSGTALEALVQQRRKADAARFESGFLLLGGPPAAYGSRLALIE